MDLEAFCFELMQLNQLYCKQYSMKKEIEKKTCSILKKASRTHSILKKDSRTCSILKKLRTVALGNGKSHLESSLMLG